MNSEGARIDPAGLSAPGLAVKPGGTTEAWTDRSARLFEELARPSRAMVRRAFRGAFCEDELDDIYAGAWVGTLRALERRHHGLADDEIRSYVFTAVANQASRELRRRGRKPTAPIELAESAPDAGTGPEESAVASEHSRVTRDLLSSLPPRRRAVMLLRYGWGLEPKQVCGLVSGLSARAYRKEVTRGVDDLVEHMHSFERGEWCDEREPVLKAFAAGVADPEQKLQAQAHLSHCRGCSDFVARLNGHLHDLGAGAIGPMAIDGLDGHISLGDRFADLGQRLRDAADAVVSRGSAEADGSASLATAGGARGAGAAGAGAFAKFAGLGTAGKVALTCLGGGAAATACVAAAVSPLGIGGPGAAHDRPPEVRHAAQGAGAELAVATEAVAAIPAQLEASQPQHATEAGAGAREPATPSEPPAPAPASDPAPDPVAPSAPPVQQEFGVAAAASASPSPVSASGGGGGTSGGGSAGPSPVQQEFGP